MLGCRHPYTKQRETEILTRQCDGVVECTPIEYNKLFCIVHNNIPKGVYGWENKRVRKNFFTCKW